MSPNRSYANIPLNFDLIKRGFAAVEKSNKFDLCAQQVSVFFSCVFSLLRRAINTNNVAAFHM